MALDDRPQVLVLRAVRANNPSDCKTSSQLPSLDTAPVGLYDTEQVVVLGAVALPILDVVGVCAGT